MNGTIWSTSRFLSYGTLSVPIEPNSFSQIRRESESEDGWTILSLDALLKYIRRPEDYSVVTGLRLLISHQFISASYSAPRNDTVLIRIYLIPYDLPGAQGKLRNRAEPLLTSARGILANLLPNLNRTIASWDGRLELAPTSTPTHTATTLTELYEALPSPSGSITATSTPITRRLLNYDDPLNNLGLRSTLHRYQRRTIAAMVEKESKSNSTAEPDPLFLPVKGMNAQEFYFQPGTMEVLIERPKVDSARGGILCEELGTGKTVMCLGLILFTLTEISTPEPSMLDTRPILTPVALRHFPGSEFSAARARLLLNNRKALPPRDSRQCVPTLVELLLHKLAVEPVVSVPPSRAERYEQLKEAVEDLEQYNGPKQNNIPFYLDYQNEPIDYERTNRRNQVGAKQAGPFMLYLTSASLVVVPPNLLLQWTQEISLHCEDHVRVCVLKGTEAMLPARILASEYDIILMTYSRFTAESRASKDNSTTSPWTGCSCAEYHNVRVPRCVCTAPASSPLRHVRWKRLIIDEGHVSATLATELTGFTKSLSVERRWIVSGTPTTNLLGLSLGKKVVSFDALARDSESIESSRATSLSNDDNSLTLTGERIWTREDGEDLNKLGIMITHFVGVPQLLAKPSLMESHVREPLLNGRGSARKSPRPGAIEVLKQLMASVMLRHRIADVEEEVVLPPVTHELVFLQLHPIAVKSYNAMQASIAINAITSERKDLDYLFHPRNANLLAVAMQNMSQILFWGVDADMYHAADNISDGGAKLRGKLSPTTGSEDRLLLENSIRHYGTAFNDPLWRAIQTHEDVPYQLTDVVKPIMDIWSRTIANGALYIHADRIKRLRDWMVSHPLASEEAICRAGREQVEEDVKWRAEVERRERQAMKGKSTGSSGASHEQSRRKAKATEAIKSSSDAKTVTEIHKSLEQVELGITMDTETRDPPSILLARSHIGQAKLGTTTSSKLNYIINEILQYSKTEKFLIFSDSVLTLAHIKEAVELIGVDYLYFSNQIKADVRTQMVLTFQTSEKYRVFLAELKLGARGLNLVSASRIIFCEPVWRPDVESQAIKRCHRIGQTRPITVKTLAIRATAEETMAARRKALQDVAQMPKLIEEAGFRSYIANPKFLPETPMEDVPSFEAPLVKFGEPDNALQQEADVDMPFYPLEHTPPPTPPARRKIRFSDDTDGQSPPKRQKIVVPRHESEASVSETTSRRKVRFS
ncbi:Helicase C-terminal domain-containing protein [Mycena indigotica]|uniref:Helicase C-terminal domain-containing protein n=1 Tax=Mycena indigotica TaxID=2126181 RepID=A0A8H6SB07_9AGAR|nr:Helicase C-terminal domain-containing protein [Mycena indigotica]KAF7295657.1 Helicase C-terminal domain-containing protein [Mycena indigotica]